MSKTFLLVPFQLLKVMLISILFSIIRGAFNQLEQHCDHASKNVISRTSILMTSLVPWEFSILKLNMKRAPEMPRPSKVVGDLVKSVHLTLFSKLWCSRKLQKSHIHWLSFPYDGNHVTLTTVVINSIFEVNLEFLIQYFGENILHMLFTNKYWSRSSLDMVSKISNLIRNDKNAQFQRSLTRLTEST